MSNHYLPADAFQAFRTGPEASGNPIPAELFAEAIKELPLDTLYAKAAELQNSISHLLDSNIQMKPFADDGDEVCKEAIAENDAVIARMEERIALCKLEAEQRGLGWGAHVSHDAAEPKLNGHVEVSSDGGPPPEGLTPQHEAISGRLTDDDLGRRLEARVRSEDGETDDDEGVHL